MRQRMVTGSYQKLAGRCFGGLTSPSKFKENNNIVESGGKLMNDQQMSEITSQLILAHAAAVEAKARLDRIRQIMSQDVANSSLTIL